MSQARPRPMPVPPRPDDPPSIGTPPPFAAERPVDATGRADARRADRKRARLERAAAQPIVRQRSRSTHRERTRNRSLTININKNGNVARAAGSTVGQSATGQAAGTPGAEFMTNEDIRAFSEHLRKQGRNRAVERGMDYEHLVQVLRHIPTSDGSLAGARMRARRVARHLRAIAAAEKVIAKQAAALYASFEREFESDLRKVGRARATQQPRAPFTFG
ncbi:plasmid transfer protein TraA [Streptomyces sp. NPDC127098]|uniref:plasmid transfer protein TraA n=1 Tax=Streptomyces sp. NPDC127098 TaxID=3347137 RepID=UPI003649780F